MTLVWILLWLMASITFVKDYKTESTRWLSAFLFLTGLGAFSVVFEENLISLITNEYKLDKGIIDFMYQFDAVISSVAHMIGAYCMLIYALTYANLIPKDKKKRIFLALLIPPILCLVLIPIRNNTLKTPSELMTYFKILSVWAVPYTFGSGIILIYSIFRENSFTMKKYKFITVVIVAPCMFYTSISNFLLRAFGIDNEWKYFEIIIPIVFGVFIYLAKKYGVLGVRLKFERHKFAFEKVLEFVSDSFVALDESLNLIEINKVFYEYFLVNKTEYKNFCDLIDNSNIKSYKDSLIKIIKESKIKNNSFIEILLGNSIEDKYFQVQANPVIINNEYLGTVLVFKDITLYKKNLELIKQNQLQLIEKERLLTLSHLMGGVAHNLKTPLLSSSGGIHIIKRDIDKVYKSLQENDIDLCNITNIMGEIDDWYKKVKENLIYMSDVINTLKSQVKEVNQVSEDRFTIKEVVDKISILMSYKFKEKKCEFIKEIKIDYNDDVKGEMNSLLQVLSNLIINALEASNKEDKVILGAYREKTNVIFYVKNYGNGIQAELQSSIFNKMVTTKGKEGTGLGLYISKSIVKGRFNGDIYFETNDKETTFFVKIPFKEGA